MRLTEGTQLRLILTAKDRMVLEPAQASAEPKERPEWKWTPNDDWRPLREF
jgi:hypothetical protein